MEMEGVELDSEMDGTIELPHVAHAEDLNGVRGAASAPPAPAPAPTPASAPTPLPPSPLPAPPLPDLTSLIPMPRVSLEQSVIPPAALATTSPPVQIFREESPAPRLWCRPEPTPEPELRTDSGATQEKVIATVDAVPPNIVPASLVPPPKAPPHPTSFDLPDSSDWPPHMVDANHYFTKDSSAIGGGFAASPRDWGGGWLACVQEFANFQQGACFPDVGPSFPPVPNIRPPEIAAWMKNRRPWRDVEITDTEEFRRKWCTWWNSLQPSSRISETKGETLPPTVDMDWSRLQKPGKNSFLLIMLSLVWWEKASNRDEAWSAAVADISAVLRCLQGAPGTVSDVAQKQEILGNSGAANVTRPKASKCGCDGNGEKEGSSKRPRRR